MTPWCCFIDSPPPPFADTSSPPYIVPRLRCRNRARWSQLAAERHPQRITGDQRNNGQVSWFCVVRRAVVLAVSSACLGYFVPLFHLQIWNCCAALTHVYPPFLRCSNPLRSTTHISCVVQHTVPSVWLRAKQTRTTQQ